MIRVLMHVPGRYSNNWAHGGAEAMGSGAPHRVPVQVQVLFLMAILTSGTASPIGCCYKRTKFGVEYVSLRHPQGQ